MADTDPFLRAYEARGSESQTIGDCKTIGDRMAAKRKGSKNKKTIWADDSGDDWVHLLSRQQWEQPPALKTEPCTSTPDSPAQSGSQEHGSNVVVSCGSTTDGSDLEEGSSDEASRPGNLSNAVSSISNGFHPHVTLAPEVPPCVWTGGKLKGRDTRIVSSMLYPVVVGGPGCPATAEVKVSIFPVVAEEVEPKKGGACFEAANGMGRIELKCYNPVDVELSVCITVGGTPTRTQLHNFAEKASMAFDTTWDFKASINHGVDLPTVSVALQLLSTPSSKLSVATLEVKPRSSVQTELVSPVQDSAPLQNFIALAGPAQDQLQPAEICEGEQGALRALGPDTCLTHHGQRGKRFDPDDDRAYTLFQLKNKYRNKYSAQQIKDYFYECAEASFHVPIGIEEFPWRDDRHWVSSRLIGRKGEKSKTMQIWEACYKKARVKLCGKGSGTEEKDKNGKDTGKESTGPLTLCVSCETKAAYQKATQMVEDLVRDVQAKYKKHCDANNKDHPELIVSVKPGCREESR